ncbi:hypothetical protein AKO1_009101 [Acrasis kona]|uniref:Uncharacterized protein n=1 Tax=Acrasis kona TaxID=1008807 RepID=A0AAW2ZIG2_9EUKA
MRSYARVKFSSADSLMPGNIRRKPKQHSGPRMDAESYLRKKEQRKVLTPRKQLFATVVNGLRSLCKKEKAEEIMPYYRDEVWPNAIHIPLDDQVTVFELLSRQNPPPIKSMLDLYSSMIKNDHIKPDSRLVGHLLFAFSECPHPKNGIHKHVERASTFVKEQMPRYHIPLTLIIVNNILRACFNHLKQVHSLVGGEGNKEEKREEFLKSAAPVYDIAKSYYDSLVKRIKNEDQESTEDQQPIEKEEDEGEKEEENKHVELLETDPTKASLTPDSSTFTYMINVHSANDAIHKDPNEEDPIIKCFQVYDQARLSKVPLKIHLYNTLMVCVMNNKYWQGDATERSEVILGIYKDLIEDSFSKPTSHTFTLMLQCINKCRVNRGKTAQQEERIAGQKHYVPIRILATYKEMMHQCKVTDLDSALLNYACQSLAQNNHLEEAHDLLINKMRLSATNKTSYNKFKISDPFKDRDSGHSLVRNLTCQILLRKLVARKCKDTSELHKFVIPVLALMRDEGLHMSKERLTYLVQRMVDTTKPKTVVKEFCEYCERHFGVIPGEISTGVMEKRIKNVISKRRK